MNSDFRKFYFDEAQSELGWIPVVAASTGSHTLTGASTSQASTASTGAITQAHALVGANAAQASGSSTAGITQVHVAVGTASGQANTSTTGAVSQAHQLVGAGSAQAATSGTGAITQDHALAGAATTQSNDSSLASLGAAPHALAGSTSSQASTSTAGVITQHHALISAGTDQAASSASGVIAQIHQLVGDTTLQTATSGTGTTVAPADPRYARPVSDITAGAWLASTGDSLADVINEPSADATDYIFTTTPGSCEIKLGPVEDPGTSSNQVVRYQIWSPEADALIVRLKQGSTTIASWYHEALPTTPTTFARALTGPECDSITNYSDLRFEFTAG